jgi:hypothetical protein
MMRSKATFSPAVAGSRSPVAVPQSSPVGLPPVAEQEKDDFSLYHAFGSDENLDLEKKPDDDIAIFAEMCSNPPTLVGGSESVQDPKESPRTRLNKIKMLFDDVANQSVAGGDLWAAGSS